MIHEVRLPRENHVYLWQITRLQMDALTCAAHLGANFCEHSLKAALNAKMSAQRAAGVAEWIFTHKEMREGLDEFAKGASCQQQCLAQLLWQDVTWLRQGSVNHTLNRRLAGSHLSPCEAGAKRFLLAFYDKLRDGIPTDILAHDPCKYGKYGRRQFFEAYERANPSQAVCAFCDEHRPITILRGEYLGEIEHYFPKAIYPHLSCHPYNLIPICWACNQAHRARDPLEPKNGGARRTLGEVFLPYRRESVSGQGRIRLMWSASAPQELSLTVQQMNTGPGNGLQTKLAALSEIYDIPRRWQNRIHTIGEQLWRHIIAFARAGADFEHLDAVRCRLLLERLLEHFIEDVGRSPWSYVMMWYLGHLIVGELDQSTNTASASPLLDTLQEMIQKPAKSPMRWQVKDILQQCK